MKESEFKKLLEDSKISPGPWIPLIPDDYYFPSLGIGPPLPFDKEGSEGDRKLYQAHICVNEGPTPEDVQAGESFGTLMTTCDANVIAMAQVPEMLRVLVEVDALFENLWKAVNWGLTYNLDIARLNAVPLEVKRVLVKALTMEKIREREEEKKEDAG